MRRRIVATVVAGAAGIALGLLPAGAAFASDGPWQGAVQTQSRYHSHGDDCWYDDGWYDSGRYDAGRYDCCGSAGWNDSDRHYSGRYGDDGWYDEGRYHWDGDWSGWSGADHGGR